MSYFSYCALITLTKNILQDTLFYVFIRFAVVMAGKVRSAVVLVTLAALSSVKTKSSGTSLFLMVWSAGEHAHVAPAETSSPFSLVSANS